MTPRLTKLAGRQADRLTDRLTVGAVDGDVEVWVLRPERLGDALHLVNRLPRRQHLGHELQGAGQGAGWWGGAGFQGQWRQGRVVQQTQAWSALAGQPASKQWLQEPAAGG